MDPSRTDSIAVKYDPMGNRVYKSSTVDGVTAGRKFIVDISGQLPTILSVTDAGDPNLLISSYTYADAQVLSQRQYPVPTDPNIYDAQFYVHDRLGSVRLVVDYNDIDAYVSVANSYTYTPFGSHYDGEAPAETVENPFKFTGQWLDAEINQYYLRARMYDPTMMRFTSRDPQAGRHTESLSLHKYLYTANDPSNRTDPTGEYYINVAAGLNAAATVYATGLIIAAIGTDHGNFDLIGLGASIQQLSGLAFAWGYATAGAGGQFPTVSRWGDQGRGAGWVMRGNKNLINYICSGKWQPGWFPGGNQFAWASTGHSWIVDSSKLSWPSGFFGFLKGLIGQRIYTP